jgi:uroporphyrinogen-III decarboxylase
MSLDRVAPTMLGMVGLTVTLVAASTVWLFLMSPVTVATAMTGGSISPLLRQIADTVFQTLTAMLRYL